MTRPTDAAIARAFWEWTTFNTDGSAAWKECERATQKCILNIAKRLDELDAESPAGTAPVNGPHCKYCGKETHHIGDVCFFCSKEQKAEKVTTSPERVQIPAESKHVQCPRCPAHMPVGLHCGGPNCPLRK